MDGHEVAVSTGEIDAPIHVETIMLNTMCIGPLDYLGGAVERRKWDRYATQGVQYTIRSAFLASLFHCFRAGS